MAPLERENGPGRPDASSGCREPSKALSSGGFDGLALRRRHAFDRVSTKTFTELSSESHTNHRFLVVHQWLDAVRRWS
ncbi:hypothetical protein [Microcystis phage Mwe-Yong1]|nr:hypothetical protein [Microcystis phage Mwe-Yong1]